MKTLRLFSLVTLAAGFASASLSASDVKASVPAKLQVSIAMPDLPGRSLDENTYAAQSFATTLTKTFKRQGDPRELIILRREAAATAGSPHLKLELVEWRSTIPGEMYCAFNATLIAGDTRSDLGRFFASEPMSVDQERSMQLAAASAVKKLCKQLGSVAPVAMD